ncbi:MAG: YgeY family selenium metabolism-linked hydrolase [Bacteroidetes bacterium]|nr:YgeY family selenium metabolism-linked hydrolase [Bacteroidota bacterium]
MKTENIFSSVQSERNNIVKFLSDIVRIESITCNEETVIKRVKKEMEILDYDEIFIDSFGSIIGRIGNGPKILVFDAHLDVVGAEGQDWETDPFKAVIKDGKIFGRGTVDDKGPFACTLYAGKIIKDLKLADSYTVYVVGSIVEEECEGLALGAFLEEFDITPDQVVIAESSELEICRGHKGRAQITATFKGESVHASMHQNGVNPIETALPFLTGLIEFDNNIPEDEELGKGHITVVDTVCDSLSLSSLPTSAKIVLDRRTTTMDTYESIIQELKALPNADKCELKYAEWKNKGYNGIEIGGEEYFPAWVLSKNHPLIQSGVKAYKELFKKDPVVTTWGFSTNGNYTMGKKEFPTIGFGPGEMALCHLANEHVVIDDLLTATVFYAGLTARLKG